MESKNQASAVSPGLQDGSAKGPAKNDFMGKKAHPILRVGNIRGRTPNQFMFAVRMLDQFCAAECLNDLRGFFVAYQMI